MKRKIYVLLSRPLLLFTVLFLALSVSTKAQTGEALHFLGDDDYVGLPINVSGSYTKEAWISPDNTTGFPNLISGTTTALYLNGGVLSAGHFSTGFSDLVDPSGAVPTGVWTHVAVTYNGTTGQMTLYKNGVAVHSVINLNPYTETNLELGRFNFASHYNGKMDEVRIWNVERTPAEIAGSMSCEVNDDAPGLVAYYKFNQGLDSMDNSGVTTLLDSHDTCTPANGFLVGFALTPGSTSNWVAPGAFTTAYCNPIPNIRVLGLSDLCILDGDATPDPLDGTDFGQIGASGLTRTFTIFNSGLADLNISGITSSNSGDFTITSMPASPIAGGASSTFEVTFNPSVTLGMKSATITINSDDVDEGIYNFDVQGEAVGAGEALHFEGIVSYVELPIALSGSYTKELWINPDAAALVNFPNLISGDNTALYLSNGQVAAGHAPTFTQTLGGGALLPNTWNHVAVTYDAGTGSMLLYLNGLMVSSGTTTDPYSETSLYLGLFLGSNLFTGVMDEVRIWNVVRSSAEINANMNCKLNGDEPGLIAYYDFNQGIAAGNNAGENILLDRTDNCAPINGNLISFGLNGTVSNWVSPGGTTGVCGGAAPNIRVLGLSSLCILDGDMVPDAADGTDFGFYADPGIDRTFTITNNGTAALNISGINISGTDAGWFTVIAGPVLTTLQPGQSTTFTVHFYGIGLGIRMANITIVNDDADESNYTFAVQGEGTILVPVSLTDFTGETDSKVVNLFWNTENEINNRGFEVQRSDERQRDWATIGFVAASGEAHGNYRLTDATPKPGINTYRLKQVDHSGAFTYSNVLAFNVTVKQHIVRTYPNPFIRSFVLSHNDEQLLNTRAEVVHVSGARVATVWINSYSQQLNLDALPAGVYIIRFANGTNTRLVKQ